LVRELSPEFHQKYLKLHRPQQMGKTLAFDHHLKKKQQNHQHQDLKKQNS
jgi:hypothetical protein